MNWIIEMEEYQEQQQENYWEDDFYQYNQNEADDYRHELDHELDYQLDEDAYEKSELFYNEDGNVIDSEGFNYDS